MIAKPLGQRCLGPPFWRGRISWERGAALVAGLLGVLCLGWCCFVHLNSDIAEALRAIAGMICLWAPLGSVVYLLLCDRCSDATTRFTISWAASYALTTAAYAAFGAVGTIVPGFAPLFYVGQALLLIGALLFAARRKLLGRPVDWLRRLGRVDGWLVLLIGLSVFVGDRYKTYATALPDGSRRIAIHGDATYLASLSCELARQTPPLEQPARAGLKERAYHMFPHLTTMLIARYSAQPDMLRALCHYTFTVVEMLLCLTFFCIGRHMTGSRFAGYFSCSLVYILAIPTAPLIHNGACYFFFTWHPHATSSLEPSLLCSPQMYCSLPVVMTVLLLVLQLSIQISRRQSIGALAILTALLAAATMRFRVQTFLILFPGVMLCLGCMWYHTRQRVFGAAILLGGLFFAAQLCEMRMEVYYPDSSQLVLENNMLSHRCPFMNAWPGAETLRGMAQQSLSEPLYLWAWQVVGLTGFALLCIAGLPVTLASLFHFARPRSWRSDTAGFTALVAWLALGTAIGGACLCTTYDVYSVGGQSLYMVGWYLLPLLAVGLWQIAALLPRRLAGACRPYSIAAGALLLVAAMGWQQVRPPSQLHGDLLRSPLILSRDEWTAMNYMRDHLPQEAVILFNANHLVGNCCIVSSLTGRRAFFEYLCMTRFLTGGADDNNEGRAARRERVWNAVGRDEFAKAMSATAATHVLEYAQSPLRSHPSEALEPFWSSPDGQIKVWTFHDSPDGCPAERLASRPASE
jgi:hypothetical protein